MVRDGGRRGSLSRILSGPNLLMDFGVRGYFRRLLALISLFEVLLIVFLPGSVLRFVLLLSDGVLMCFAVW